jgi:predicted transcriptional regulator
MPFKLKTELKKKITSLNEPNALLLVVQCLSVSWFVNTRHLYFQTSFHVIGWYIISSIHLAIGIAITKFYKVYSVSKNTCDTLKRIQLATL